MAFTRLTNSTTADADEVHANFTFIGEGSRLPMIANTSGVLIPTTSVYDVGSDTYKWRDGYFSGSITAKDITLSGGIDTDGTTLKTVVLSIGAWNMDTTNSINITHQIIPHTNIRSVEAMIRLDDDTLIYKLEATVNFSTTAQQGGIDNIGSTTVGLVRLNGGFFDSANFDSMTGADNNRGWLTIQYQA